MELFDDQAVLDTLIDVSNFITITTSEVDGLLTPALDIQSTSAGGCRSST